MGEVAGRGALHGCGYTISLDGLYARKGRKMQK